MEGYPLLTLPFEVYNMNNTFAKLKAEAFGLLGSREFWLWMLNSCKEKDEEYDAFYSKLSCIDLNLREIWGDLSQMRFQAKFNGTKLDFMEELEVLLQALEKF